MQSPATSIITCYLNYVAAAIGTECQHNIAQSCMDAASFQHATEIHARSMQSCVVNTLAWSKNLEVLRGCLADQMYLHPRTYSLAKPTMHSQSDVHLLASLWNGHSQMTWRGASCDALGISARRQGPRCNKGGLIQFPACDLPLT